MNAQDDHVPEYVLTDVEGTLTAGAMWRAIGRRLSAGDTRGPYRRFMLLSLPGVLAARLRVIDSQTYKNHWLEKQASLLTGSTTADIEELAEWVVDHELQPQLRPAVLEELAEHSAGGRRVVLASGMYEQVLTALARRLPFSPVDILGTPLQSEGGRFTGSFAAPVCVAAEKARRSRAHVGDGIIRAAYGDTDSDTLMLELSIRPVAVHPDRRLARIATARGWRIIS